MRNKTLRSRLLALGLGIGCCIPALPTQSQLSPLEAQSLEVSYSASIRVGTWLRNAPTTCDASPPLEVIDAEFVQSLLSAAAMQAEQIEDLEHQGEAFYTLGKSYACINQPEIASAFLVQAEEQAQHISLASMQSDRLIDIAAVYGDLMGDVDKMNAILADVAKQVGSNPETVNHSSFLRLNKIARLYARHGQYQNLRVMTERIDSVDVRRQLMVDAAAFFQDVAIAEVSPIGEQSAIAYLFSEFDIPALVEQLPEEEAELPEPSPLPSAEREQSPIRLYSAQLRELQEQPQAEEVLSNPEVFIASQKATIEQMVDPLHRAIAIQMLGDFLSIGGQPRLAITLFEEALQMFRNNVSEASQVVLSDLGISSEDDFYNYITWTIARA